MNPVSVFSSFIDLLDKIFPDLSNYTKLLFFLPILMALIWISIVLLSPPMRKRLVQLVFKNKWFYIYISLFFAISSLIVVLKRPVQFYVFVDKSFNTTKYSSAFLQRWDETACNTKNTMITHSNTGSIVTVYFDIDKYGFGFQYRGLATDDLSKYRDGYLCFSLRVDPNSVQRLRVGIQSLERCDAWFDIQLNELRDQKGEWHDFAIPIPLFKTASPCLSLSDIDQFFMLKLYTSQKGRLNIKNIFWKSN